MVIRRKSRIQTLQLPLGICLLAAVSAVALVVVVVTLSTPTVRADVRLATPPAAAPQPAQMSHLVTAPPASPTAAQKAAVQAEVKRRADILHGIASWYGGVFNGRRTASGEVFDMHAMTACHATLPFGSVVKVINRKNKRSVVVRITDRGDLVEEGRIIDLSYAAAEKLAITQAGLAKVDLEVISLGRQTP
jgi:rare lipoprotein A